MSDDAVAKSGGSEPQRPPRFRRQQSSLVARGEPMLWLTGGALVTCILMIAVLLGWIALQGFRTFWPDRVVAMTAPDGRGWLGEVAARGTFRPDATMLAKLDEAEAALARDLLATGGGQAERCLLRTANYELTGTHFEWIEAWRVANQQEPDWALTVERLEWGRFYGQLLGYVHLTPLNASLADPMVAIEEVAARVPVEAGKAIQVLVVRTREGKARETLVDRAALEPTDRILGVAEVWRGAPVAWEHFQRRHPSVLERVESKRDLERGRLGQVNRRIEKARLSRREAELAHTPPPGWVLNHEELLDARFTGKQELEQRLQRRVQALERDFGPPSPEFLAAIAHHDQQTETAQREQRELERQIEELDRELRRHRLVMATAQGVDVLLDLAQIVRAYPANQLDFGGRLSVYLSRWWEFLSAQPRNSNFEGGVFPAIFGTVALALIMCFLVVPFGVLAALYLREYAKAGPVISAVRIAVNNLAGVPSIVFGVFGLGFFCYLLGSNIDQLLFAAKLPAPTFGTGGLLWASMTLALLTLPVVIVATEEALAAVPNSMREGSYACGASKWQTIRRIVLPRALPGIMTGAILAMARGAGEVAPLMLLGVAKVQAELPIDMEFPFGVQRSFMHLGFHISDLGFQSPNAEAAKPMVYTTTLLLISIIATLNLTAVFLRSRLHRKFVGGHF